MEILNLGNIKIGFDEGLTFKPISVKSIRRIDPTHIELAWDNRILFRVVPKNATHKTLAIVECKLYDGQWDVKVCECNQLANCYWPDRRVDSLELGYHLLT